MKTELYKDVAVSHERGDLVIVTHKNCPDGMGSVWAIAESLYENPSDLQDITIFMQYNDVLDMEALRGKFVLFTDFSLKRGETEALKEVAEKVVVIDHHKSAEQELAGLDNVIFDMDESGATLTWKALNGLDADVPDCLQYIKDRDLWQFKLPGTHAFTEGFRKVVMLNDLSTLDGINIWSTEVFITEQTLERVTFKNEIVDGIADPKKIDIVNIGGVDVPTTNNHQFISEVGNAIADKYDGVSAQWFIGKNNEGEDSLVVSLRSIGNACDVSELAKQFGGGGHKNAAGFSVPVKGNLEKLILKKEI